MPAPANTVGPFLRIASVHFPARADLLAVQAVLSRPLGDSFAGSAPGGAQRVGASAVVVTVNGNSLTSIPITPFVNGSTGGNTEAFNLGGIVSDGNNVTPVNPFNSGMLKHDYIFTPAGLSSIASASSTGTQGTSRGYVFVNLTRLRLNFGLTNNNSIVVSVAYPVSAETTCSALLEIFPHATSLPMPAGGPSSFSLQSNIFGASRSYNAQKIGSPNTSTQNAKAVSIAYGFAVNGMGGAYTISNGGDSLSAGMSAAFSAAAN